MEGYEKVFTMRPGCIIPECTVMGRDYYDRGWIVDFYKDDVKNSALLKDNYVPAGMVIQPNLLLKNLIVIGKGKRLFHVAIEGYMQDLFNHYYNYHSQKVKNREDWRYFYERWRIDCVDDFESNFEISATLINYSYRKLKSYRLLKDGEYVLPLFGYIDLEQFQGKDLFYPNPFRKDLLLPRSVYRTDQLEDFPIKYTAYLRGHTQGGMSWERKIIIYLHGFISPAKWHYVVWKHGRYDLRSIFPFNMCKVNDDEDSCDEDYCIDNRLFSNVHSNIASDCKKFLRKVVTFFERLATNKTNIYSVPEQNYYQEIVMGSIIKLNGENWFIVLYGKCFNLNDNIPVFHMTPVTVYQTQRQRIVLNNDTRNWKLIYEGRVEEIKGC